MVYDILISEFPNSSRFSQNKLYASHRTKCDCSHKDKKK
jgi:hypothetical protein